MSKDTARVDVQINCYASLYFIERTSLTYNQSTNLMRDPELIAGMGNFGIEWTWKMQNRDFIMALFNKPELKMLNMFLDKFAGEYRKREPAILKRLKSLGVMQS